MEDSYYVYCPNNTITIGSEGTKDCPNNIIILSLTTSFVVGKEYYTGGTAYPRQMTTSDYENIKKKPRMHAEQNMTKIAQDVMDTDEPFILTYGHVIETHMLGAALSTLLKVIVVIFVSAIVLILIYYGIKCYRNRLSQSEFVQTPGNVNFPGESAEQSRETVHTSERSNTDQSQSIRTPSRDGNGINSPLPQQRTVVVTYSPQATDERAIDVRTTDGTPIDSPGFARMVGDFMRSSFNKMTGSRQSTPQQTRRQITPASAPPPPYSSLPKPTPPSLKKDPFADIDPL